MFLAYEHPETVQKWGELNNRGKAEVAGYDGSFGITGFTKSDFYLPRIAPAETGQVTADSL